MTRDIQAAGRLFEQSLALARELGSRRDIARVLYYGAREHARGRRAAAAVAFEESLAISREIGHTRGIARALGGLAFAHSPEDLARTRSMLEESLSLYRELGDCQAIGETLNHLGWVVDRLGDREGARTLREESLACAREAGDMRGAHFASWRLGFSALDRGDTAAARRYGEEDVTAARQLGEHAILVDALLNASHFAQRAGDLAAARAYSEEAIGIARETGAEAAAGSGLYHLACATPDLATRRSLLEEACAAHARGGSAPSFATVALADAARLGGDRDYAAAKLHLALTTAVERSQHFLGVCAIMSAGDLAEEWGDARRAARLWAAADRLAEYAGWAYCRIDRRGPEELAGCKAALGDAEFAAAADEGKRITYEEAIAYALEGLGVPPSGDCTTA
jgi:hypothetical protein